MTGIITKIILRECMEKAQADCNSSLAKPNIDINAKIELSKEHLKESRNNAYNGSEEEDVIDHIDKVLEILDSIRIPNVDTDRLRVHLFPLSLTGAAQKWWINEGSDKITAWSELVKGWGNNKLMDDIVSSDEEWEESNYENPPNTNTDSFFKPYLDAQEKGDICLVEKEHHLKNHNSDCSDEKNNDLIYEKACKAEKFKVIKYSLGANEEYIAISTREKNAWKRNEDSVSHIYQEIFQKKDKGWTVIRTKG
ncbi:hypothetical protein Tco_1280809 [Tanacetum coccineum]